MEKRKNSFFEFFKLLFVVSIMSSIVYFFVFNNIRSARIDKRINQIKKEMVRETNNSRNEYIRSEEEMSDAKVKTYARDNLGMINTSRDDYIILK